VLVEYRRQNFPTILQHFGFCRQNSPTSLQSFGFCEWWQVQWVHLSPKKLSEAQKRSEKCSHKIEFQQIISGRNKHLICREETVFCFLDFSFFFFLPTISVIGLYSQRSQEFWQWNFSVCIRKVDPKIIHQQDVVHLIQVHASRDEFHMKNPISRVWFHHLKPIQYVSGGT
jgi:hypothetical protein